VNTTYGTEKFQTIPNASVDRNLEFLSAMYIKEFLILVHSLCAEFVHALHTIEQEDSKWKPGNDRCSLDSAKTVNTSGIEQGGSNSSFSKGPEHTLEPVMLVFTVGSQEVDNKGSRIRRCTEINCNSNQVQDCEDLSKATSVEHVRIAERVKHIEGCLVCVFHIANRCNSGKVVGEDKRFIVVQILLRDIVAYAAFSSVQEILCVIEVFFSQMLQLQCLSRLTETDASPDSEPEHTVQQRSDQRVGNQFSNSTSSGNSGDKEANEAGP
jgi:hypothetical protein